MNIEKWQHQIPEFHNQCQKTKRQNSGKKRTVIGTKAEFQMSITIIQFVWNVIRDSEQRQVFLSMRSFKIMIRH